MRERERGDFKKGQKRAKTKMGGIKYEWKKIEGSKLAMSMSLNSNNQFFLLGKKMNEI